MKLTKTQKKDIEKAIYIAKVVPKEKKHKEEKQKQVEAYVAEKMAPYQSIIKKLPKGFLTCKSQFIIKYGKTYQEQLEVTLAQPISIDNNWNRGYSNVQLECKEPKWQKVFADLDKEGKEISSFREELNTELRGVLAGCSTANQLIKTFPEVKDYISMTKLEFFPLVVQTDKLKKLLKE